VAAEFLLQVDETEIVAREADEPNALVDLFDPEPLTGKARWRY
jgi:hypothetical protein